MITQFLSNDLTYALAWTLIHSLWQITLIALMMSFVLKLAKSKSAQARYLIAYSALAIALVTSITTFAIFLMQGTATTPVFVNMAEEHMKASTFQSSTNILLGWIDHYSLIIVNAWILGSVLFLIKLIGGYGYIRKLAKSAESNNEQLNKKLNKLRRKFGIHRVVQIKSSLRVTTPMVIGILRPIILFPVGLVNQLSGEEVSAILAHELAHIKRHDYLFNVIQSIAEAIYYYHPGIWYISSCIATERENVCDDMAIRMASTNVSYAKTLIKLQELRGITLRPALGMAGKSGKFSDRIKRILDVPVQSTNFKERIIALVMISFALVGYANGKQEAMPSDTDDLDVYIIDDCPQDLSEIQYYLDTIPERNNFHVKKKSKDKDLELHMEDGEIKELKIDGKVVPESDYGSLEDIIIELSPNGKKEMITVFPDCGEDFGNIYFLNKERKAYALDSVLKKMDIKLRKFEDHKSDLFGFHIDKFDNLFIDSLKQEIGEVDWADILDKKTIGIDSILDLFPHKLPSLKDTLMVYDFFGPDREEMIVMDLEGDNLFPHDFEHDFNLFESKSTVADKISNSLRKDRLIETDVESEIELTGKHLKINGEKQPSNIWKKYKRIYEEATGLTMTKRSRIDIVVEPNDNRPQSLKSTSIFNIQ